MLIRIELSFFAGQSLAAIPERARNFFARQAGSTA
jgi:hypothetical protein